MIHIPEFSHSPYAIIIILSVITGLISASLLLKKTEISKQTIRYTLLLTSISTIIIAINPVFESNKLLLTVSGIRGALGLVIGVVASCFIHREKPLEVCSSFIVSAPLMYSLSKFGCLFAGCCGGREYKGPLAVIYGNDPTSYFPTPLVDIVTFAALYFIYVSLFFKLDNKIKLLNIIWASMIPVRVLTDYLRKSHGKAIISTAQVEVLIIGAIVIALIHILKRFLIYGKRESK